MTSIREFFGRSPRLAAIGSTDYHGLGPLGYSRTSIFARERSEQGVIEAVRARRTVAYDRERVYGDAEMTRSPRRTEACRTMSRFCPFGVDWLSSAGSLRCSRLRRLCCSIAGSATRVTGIATRRSDRRGPRAAQESSRPLLRRPGARGRRPRECVGPVVRRRTTNLRQHR